MTVNLDKTCWNNRFRLPNYGSFKKPESVYKGDGKTTQKVNLNKNVLKTKRSIKPTYFMPILVIQSCFVQDDLEWKLIFSLCWKCTTMFAKTRLLSV